MVETWRPVPSLPGVMVSSLDRVNVGGIVPPPRTGTVACASRWAARP